MPINERGEYIRERPVGGAPVDSMPTRSSPPPRAPEPTVQRGEARGGGIALVIFLIVAAMAALLVYQSNRGNFSTGTYPTAPTSVTDPIAPTDSPSLPATGYIQSIGARVQELKFFDAGVAAPAKSDRVYATSFRPGDGQFFYWELNLVHPTRQARQSYAIALYLYSPDGSLKSQSRSSCYVEPDWANSFCFDKWTDHANTFTPGNYRVSLFVDGTKVAAGSFMVEALPEPTLVATDTVPLENPAPAETTIPPVDEAPKHSEPLPEPPSTTPSPPSQGWQRFGEDRPEAQQLVRTSKPVEEAQLTRKVQPAYPALAKQARVEGVVRLSGTIGTDGKLHNIRVISGHPLLSGAAMAAVAQWRYTPTRLNGNPIEAETQIDVNFTLGQ